MKEGHNNGIKSKKGAISANKKQKIISKNPTDMWVTRKEQKFLVLSREISNKICKIYIKVKVKSVLYEMFKSSKFITTLQ